MLLHKITLSEFGAYRGEQSLDLTPMKNKPIVLIGGLNGCGKTTLLDAIQLALYGPRARCSGRGSKAYDTYLRESINRQADPSRGAAICLEFTVTVEGTEHYYKVTRSWHESGKSVKEFLNVSIDEHFGDKTKGDLRATPELRHSRVLSQGWADHVEDLLPLEIASLSFFDGEKIESLADPDRAASVIESAVHSLLGVSTVQQLRTDLQALQRRQKLSDEEQHLLDNIRSQEQEQEAAQEELERATQELAHLRSEHTKATRALNSVEQAFQKEGGALFEQRVELESARKQAANQLADARAALVQTAAGALPFLMAGKQLQEVRAQFERERAAAQAREVLHVLRERDDWLLDQLPAQAHEAAVKAMEADRTERAEAAALDVDLRLPADMGSQLDVLDAALEGERGRGAELLAEAEEASEALAELDRQLAGVPARDKVEALQAKREEQLQEVASAVSACEKAAERVEELKRRRAGVRASLEKAHNEFIRTKVKAEEVERIIRFSEKARQTLARFSEALLERHIGNLEVAMIRSFRMLMRKQSLVDDIRINIDDFTLTLSDAEGKTISPGRLSAGERQLLAISLLWGLMQVAGNRLPNVIDTPLGRLDSRHREHLVDRYFPQAGEQVLLLSTDEEIDEYLLGRLKRSIARTYTLVHDDTKLTTSVVEGYWWNAGGSHVA
ncbi:DNA sulfur modification protein DndD [Streptomyces sp. NPDC001902]